MIVPSLSDLETEKLALTTQPVTSQLVGIHSGKQYLQQYDQIPDEAQPPTMLETVVPVPAPVPKDKEKQKEIRFNESLMKNPF